MRHNPLFASDDPSVVRELIAANPWAALVSAGPGGLVASHYPILLDERSAELAIVTHVGRPDEEVHDFGEREILIIVQGRHGYISPSWYAPGATPVPTWNFTVAHCHGVPEVLDADRNLEVLGQLVEHFERHVDEPLLLDRERDARLARGTVGIRVPITRFTYKRKLSQDKDPETRRRVIERLRAPGRYHHFELAEEMERELAGAE
ncbi:MAG: FMN-binding negative transcriptional regulator [Solirubrobacterales bacterium]|nr:FMN-binding negative transcriptional regulator [Solirubrobacterales bacterium]